MSAPIVGVIRATGARDREQRARLIWLAGAGLLVLAITIQPLRDTDVWWHLALGRLITTHGIPAQEPFSFLQAAHPWVGQQWLYEVLLAGLVGAGGAGLASVVMGIAGAAALVVAAAAVPRSAAVSGRWLAAAVVLGALVIGQVAGVRGQVITLLGVAIVLHVLTRWREGGKRAVWLLPPVFLLWANLHAGFVAGLALVVATLVLARPARSEGSLDRRALGLALLLSGAATLVNPAGPGLWSYVAETFANPTLTQVVTEWASPDFHNGWLQLFELQALVLVALWAAAGGPDRVHAVIALGAFAAALLAQRNVSLFAVIATPQLALYGAWTWERHFAPRRRRSPRGVRRSAARALLAGVALAATATGVTLTVLPTVTPASAAAFEASRYPKAAVDYVATYAPGRRIYTPDVWGGYVAYRLGAGAGRVVFLYDETAVFGSAALQTYLDIHLLRSDWAQVLRQERITVAIVPATSQEAAALQVLGWRSGCRDGNNGSVVLLDAAAGISAPALSHC